MATKLNNAAFERLQLKLDKLDKSKSEEIRAKLKQKHAKPAQSDEVRPRYKAMVVKKSPATRFMIDNKKIRKSVAKTSKSILEFKKSHFYGDRVQRTNLNSLLNK